MAIAPQVFQLDDEKKAVVIDPDGDTEENIWAAAEACPPQAIILEDDDGNQMFP